VVLIIHLEGDLDESVIVVKTMKSVINALLTEVEVIIIADNAVIARI
jgi:hypothetical protein